MRHEPNLRIEHYRMRHPATPAGVNWGAFIIPRPTGELRVISSGDCTDNPESCGWEHVSFSLASRTPTWDELQFVKELFWRDDETVLQFHPAKSEYVNCHPFVLHLWKRDGENHPLPPMSLIAPQKEPLEL